MTSLRREMAARNGLLGWMLSDRVLQVVRFGISGLSSTIVYFLLTIGLVQAAGMAPINASVAGYAVSLVFSYLLQSRFTFRVSRDSRAQVLRFVVISLFGFAVSYTSMRYFTDMLGLPYVVGALVVCVVLPVANFVIFKHWVFASATRKNDSGPTAG
ncbi:MAG: GtrA family protein [Devosia sp.]